MRLFIAALAIPCALLNGTAAGAQAGRQAASSSSSTSTFGLNLLKNGNIEQPIVAPNKVPGWSETEGLQQAVYGSVGGEWDWGLSGCGSCGKQYLRLQFEGNVHELSTFQTVDVSRAGDLIDKGKVTASISAWLGAFHGSDTTSTIELSYRDAGGKALGTLATSPVDSNSLPKAQAGYTGLVVCQNRGSVPAGTRTILFTWRGKASGDSGQYLALGDNFSLVLMSSE